VSVSSLPLPLASSRFLHPKPSHRSHPIHNFIQLTTHEPLVETIGYIGRLISSTQSPNWTTGPYIIQSLLLLVAPALLAASIYMLLSRLIRLTHGERYSPINPSWVTAIFVTGDILSFLAQSAGGTLLARAKTNTRIKTGQRIIIGGLGIQLLFMNLFIIITAIFHRRITFRPTSRSKRLTAPWKGMLVRLYVASALISARSGFRAVEYLQGFDGYLMRHEVFLYVFDASLMWIVMWIFYVFHPSLVFGRNGKGRGRSDGSGSGPHHRSRRSRGHRHRHSHSRSYDIRDVESSLEYPGAVHSKR
jgi:hypothetical protein